MALGLLFSSVLHYFAFDFTVRIMVDSDGKWVVIMLEIRGSPIRWLIVTIHGKGALGTAFVGLLVVVILGFQYITGLSEHAYFLFTMRDLWLLAAVECILFFFYALVGINY